MTRAALRDTRQAARATTIDIMLPPAQARFGRLARASLCGPAEAPLIVVLGGISANAFPYFTAEGAAGWWTGLFAPDGALDPGDYLILGIDFIADPSGRIAPTTLDQAAVVAAALDQIGVDRAAAIIGASYGGMIALAFAAAWPGRVDRLIAISADASPHPSSTALRELQRRVVALGLEAGAGDEGLALARGLAMLSYRTQAEFDSRFTGGIPAQDTLACSEPGAYLRARGEAYRAVMSPQRFLSLSASIDRHRVDADMIVAPSLLIGADSDLLVQPSQMKTLAAAIRGPATLHLLPSLYGHDMFLKQAAQLSAMIDHFLRTDR